MLPQVGAAKGCLKGAAVGGMTPRVRRRQPPQSSGTSASPAERVPCSGELLPP